MPQLSKQEKERVQNMRQQEAFDAWVDNKRRGLIAAATGFGKFRVGVLAALELARDFPDWKEGDPQDILWIEPTEPLRDNEIPKEFVKWEAAELLPRVHRICWASINLIEKRKYRLIVGDEFHHMTDKKSEFFKFNMPDRLLALTATIPDQEKETSKATLVQKIAPVVFSYTLDQGVEDGILADYRIWVVDCYLDDKQKVVDGGTKAKPFKQTEAAHYKYLNVLLRKAAIAGNVGWKESLVNKRAHFLSRTMSKQEVARKLLMKFTDQRILVFAGGKEQANELCEYSYHSDTNDEGLRLFEQEKINRLSSVKKLNEGSNIPNLDVLVIIQTDSHDRQMIQRIGRGVRWRDGHICQIFVLCLIGTRDESWVEEALRTFNPVKVKHYSAKNL